MFARGCAAAWGLMMLVILPIALGAPEDNAEQPPEPADNPYLAAPELTVPELVDFLQRMQQKPATVRGRPGFDEALRDAAQRVLAGSPTATQEQVAVLARFDVLSRQSIAGDQAAYDELVLMAKRYQDDKRPRIAAHVKLCLLELRTAEAGELPPEDLSKLLVDLKEFFASQTLTERHLKLASHTIRAINLLAKAEERNPHFTEFGKLFAASSDRKLSRYGRDLAKSPKAKQSELVGQTLEIEGQTVEAAPFDWAGYRGKVVLVDFWATWCGPCRAELPNVKQCYEKFKDRGFDVVGISLDQDIETLKQFLADEQIPWTNLFDETSNGWDNPVAAKYGVKAIPMAVLVDREGKVVSASARGPELERLLTELLGESAK